MATGAAALSLAEHARGAPENTRTLDVVAMVATGVELAMSLVAERRYRDQGLEEPIHGPDWETPYDVGAIAIGTIVPLACYSLGLVSRRRSSCFSIAASLAVLAGGAILRQAILHGGESSTRRPQAYFSQTRGRRGLARSRRQSMSATAQALREEGRSALTVLDRALAQPAEEMADDLPEAVRALARLRNRLIDQRRADSAAGSVAERLDRVNAILSVVAGGEYPIVGVRRERIVDARRALPA